MLEEILLFPSVDVRPKTRVAWLEKLRPCFLRFEILRQNTQFYNKEYPALDRKFLQLFNCRGLTQLLDERELSDMLNKIFEEIRSSEDWQKALDLQSKVTSGEHKETKEGRESKDNKDNKDNKEGKDGKESKEVKDAESIGKPTVTTTNSGAISNSAAPLLLSGFSATVNKASGQGEAPGQKEDPQKQNTTSVHASAKSSA